MTRLVSDPATGRSKGSRIDYALLGTPLRDWIPSTTTSILSDTLGSDHNPIQLTKGVPPFTPPPVIINDVLRLTDLKPDQVKTLHTLLEPLHETVSLFTSLINHLPPTTIFRQSEVISHTVELAAREVTNCTPHVRKPSSSEKQLSLLLGSDRNAPDFASKCEGLMSRIHEERLLRANKRVHASLVSGKGMKQALAAHSQSTTPPMALINEDREMSKSPEESCSVMSKALAALGGAMDYVVPPEVEAEFLGEVPNNPPTTNFAPPLGTSSKILFAVPSPRKLWD